MLRKLQRGVTIVEVLIALSVLAFALGTGFAIVSKSNLSIQSNREQFQAQQLANQQIEYLRASDALYNGMTEKRKKFDGGCLQKVTDAGGSRIEYMPAAECKNIAMGGADIYEVKIQCYGVSGGSAGYNANNCKESRTELSTYSVIVSWANLKGGQSQVELQYGM
jgi:prepilin-type N-terminal cleavage/methylation domain-containing protein